jgi:hypothetical protein
MIKTLRVNNGSFAKLGSVAVQAVVSSVIHEVAQQTVAQQPISVGALPARQATFSSPVLLHSINNVTKVSAASVSGIAHLLTTDSSVVIPLRTKFNVVMPTYHLTLDAGKEYDPRVTQGFVTTTTKFQPYEQLTGIAQERPEVVMLTNFQPLFTHDVVHTAPNFISLVETGGINPYMTDAGRFIDSQMQIRNLRSFNTQYLVKQLKARYYNIRQQFSDRENSFFDALNKLNTDATFLLNLVRVIESQKAQLDLRHDIFAVDPTVIGSLYDADFTQEQTKLSADVSTGAGAPRRLPSPNLAIRHKPKYDFVDTLIDLGYKQDTVQSVYSSTKIWMQTLLELSYALKFHTLQFLDIDPSYQRNDTNASTILNPKVTRFSLSTNLPNLPKLDELVNLQPTNVPLALSSIKPSFQTIYQDVFFKDEEARIAALAHLLSAEYRYSRGLSLPQVQRALTDFYGYNVVSGQGNSTIFDSIIGKFGNNISDFPAQASHALVAVAQQTTATNTGVLTFETKYVEGDTGTLTPGGDFYFDQVLQTDGKSFNTTNIDALVGVLDSSLSSFNIIVDGFNLMMKPSTRVLNNVLDIDGSILTSTGDLINAVKQQLVDANGNTSVLLQNDRLASVFARARKDNNLKSSLFLYVLSKISRAYGTNVAFFTSTPVADNTPLVDYLINQINVVLEASVPQTRTNVQFVVNRGLDGGINTDAMNSQTIAAALKAGTKLTVLIEQLMSQILTQFRTRTTAITDSFTRYSGFLDTIVMMTAFDLIISMVARYGNTDIVGAHRGLASFSQGLITYVVSRTTTDHRNSVNELTERAAGEDTRVQQLILTVTNALTVLGGSLKGVTNFLQSPTSILRLQEVAGILGNDPTMLAMLFSEQQIMMLAATVQNLLSAANNGLSAKQPTAQSDPNDSQEIKILDESQVPPAARDALLGYFGTEDFASVKGSNKRILTVGIPLGFTQRIKQKVDIRNQQRASFKNRRNDVVQVCVYKIDMVNSDVIYKPRRFMFEMSRFPVRLSTVSWLPLPDRPASQDIVNSIPTLNFTQNVDTSTSTAITNGIEYASGIVAGNDGIKDVRVAMDDDSYSFLTANQKAEILQNHVASQLLEAYIKLMTGINVAEYGFDMTNVLPPVEVSFVKTLTEHQVAHVSDLLLNKATTGREEAKVPTGGVMFSTTAHSPPASVQRSFAPIAISQPQLSNPAGVAGAVAISSQFRALQQTVASTKTLEQQAVIGNLDTNLNAVSARNVPMMVEHFQTISSFSNTLSSASDPASLNQKVVTPKLFDRVFNFIIDPTDFEVDVATTIATPYGQKALELMIQNGEIVSSTENDQALSRATLVGLRPVTPGSRPFIQGHLTPNVNAYSYRPRDKNEGDLIADKYFITIETFDEGT